MAIAAAVFTQSWREVSVISGYTGSVRTGQIQQGSLSRLWVVSNVQPDLTLAAMALTELPESLASHHPQGKPVK